MCQSMCIVFEDSWTIFPQTNQIANFNTYQCVVLNRFESQRCGRVINGRLLQLNNKATERLVMVTDPCIRHMPLIYVSLCQILTIGKPAMRRLSQIFN